jgi:hypothetical protein
MLFILRAAQRLKRNRQRRGSETRTPPINGIDVDRNKYAVMTLACHNKLWTKSGGSESIKRLIRPAAPRNPNIELHPRNTHSTDAA